MHHMYTNHREAGADRWRGGSRIARQLEPGGDPGAWRMRVHACMYV